MQAVGRCGAATRQHLALVHRRPNRGKDRMDHQQHAEQALRATEWRRSPDNPSEADHQPRVHGAEQNPERSRGRTDGGELTDGVRSVAVALPQRAHRENHRHVQSCSEDPAAEQDLTDRVDPDGAALGPSPLSGGPERTTQRGQVFDRRNDTHVLPSDDDKREPRTADEATSRAASTRRNGPRGSRSASSNRRTTCLPHADRVRRARAGRRQVPASVSESPETACPGVPVR